MMVAQLRAMVDAMSDDDLDATLTDVIRQAGPDNEPTIRRAAAALYRALDLDRQIDVHVTLADGQTVQVGTTTAGAIYGMPRRREAGQ